MLVTTHLVDMLLHVTQLGTLGHTWTQACWLCLCADLSYFNDNDFEIRSKRQIFNYMVVISVNIPLPYRINLKSPVYGEAT